MSNYLIISPSYNEVKTIEKFIERVKSVIQIEDFLVVDDGSTDGTVDVLKRKGIRFLTLPHRGKGSAIKRGIEFALRKGIDFVIFLDSDLQHPPELIPIFIDRLRNGADIVIGSRWSSLSNMPRDRYFSNRLTTFFVSLLVGRKLYDTQSGFRGYRTQLFKSLVFETEGYETETEILIKLIKSHRVNKIAYVNIPALYNNTESKIRRTRDTLKFLKMYFRLLWKAS